MARTLGRLVALAFTLSSAHAAAQQATVLNRVVAVVDGEAIFLSDLQRLEEDVHDRRVALELLIQRALLARLAEREGAVPDADVDRAIEHVRLQAWLSEDDFWALIRQHGFTRATYRAEVRQQLGVLRAVDARLPPNLPRERIDEERQRIERELIRELRARARIDIRI